MSYEYLLDIAIILIGTKVLGLLVRKIQMPQVVGALLAGVILGPALLNILKGTEFLKLVAELGVIVLMFLAGLGTDLKELKKVGKSGFLVALIGVLFPLGMGCGLGFLFNHGSSDALIENIFVGVVLTATSVSITVETLKELGKLKTKVGNTILAAALMDDILGLIALTVVSSLAGGDANVPLVLGKIVLFFVCIIIAGVIISKCLNWYIRKQKNKNLRRFSIAAFVLCLLLAYSAEEFFGVADIIGAFAAGVIIATTPKARYIENRVNPLGYLLLSPIFFASVGLNVSLPDFSWEIVLFSASLVAVAILSKFIGCGLGAKFTGFTTKESMQVGIGMACRGEVALIVANKGQKLGVMPDEFFGPIIIMVVVVMVVTPVLLKLLFKEKTEEIQSSLARQFEITDKMEEESLIYSIDDADGDYY